MTGTAEGSASCGRSHPCASASSCRWGSCRRGTVTSTHCWLSAMPFTASYTWPRKEAPPLSLLWKRRAGPHREWVTTAGSHGVGSSSEGPGPSAA